MKTLWLRIIYAAHMALPLSLASFHIARLDEGTAARLRALFS
jgi:hypothetical protein